MLTKFMKKYEIDEILEDKGDFVKMDYLERFLKLTPPIEMRKFAYLKLAEINLNRKSYEQAAKMFKNASINSITFREKKEFYTKETKALIQANKFEESNIALKRTLNEGTLKEKKEIFQEIIEFYKEIGNKLETAGLPGKATNLYEKLIKMKITEEEKEEVKDKLLNLYQKLGKTKEYDFLKGQD